MEHTSNKEVAITVTHVKWVKTRILVLELGTLIMEDRLSHKILECIRGFLIYVARTFKWITPYLKVPRLNIDECREGREKDFYKIKIQPRVRLKV